MRPVPISERSDLSVAGKQRRTTTVPGKGFDTRMAPCAKFSFPPVRPAATAISRDQQMPRLPYQPPSLQAPSYAEIHGTRGVTATFIRLSRAVLLFADCFSSPFAISSFRPEEDDRECFWVGGAVFRLGLIIGAPTVPGETFASDPSIVSKTSTMVLSEARASWHGHIAFSGHARGTMVRRVPRQTDTPG